MKNKPNAGNNSGKPNTATNSGKPNTANNSGKPNAGPNQGKPPANPTPTPGGTDDDFIPTFIPDVVVEPRNPKDKNAPQKSDIPDVKIVKPPSSDDKKDKDDPTKKEKTRMVPINPAVPQNHFVNNHVKTSKYSIFTFLPYFLYEQFRRVSNVFFLLMALAQQIPHVSPTGKYTTALPLLIIVSASAVKEVLEDRKRHKGDTKTNNQEVDVLRGETFQPTKWKDILVGDFVRLKSESFVPADLVLYASSEPLGMCFIETANLDGETNLKLRQALPRTAELKKETEIAALKGFIECGVPNRMIYEFAGTLNFETEPNPYSLGPDQLVLRGAKLRNTKWIIGQAIYTGHETKLLKNSTQAPLKRSTLEKATNVQIAILFAALILISGISFVMYATRKTPAYISEDEEFDWKTFLQFITFILLYNNLIPISLSVTLEFVRFWQALFINWDNDIYHVESKTAAQARTSNLNEELGQIRYIFSDKTGTLTKNIMEFKGCTVGGVLLNFKDLFPNAAKGSKIKDDVTGNPLIQSIKKGNTSAEEFLLALSLCHYVIPERTIGEDGSEELVYNAASPDERALVEGAQKFGYVFVSRTPTSVEISVQGESRTYGVLNLIEFTSTRKRMTVILRCPDGKIRLYCKGADSVILERLVTKSPKEESDLKTTEEHLDYFATEGLRTLCVAMKILSEEEHKEWDVGFQKAISAIHDRENEVAKSAELIESKLTLVGSTAIEDKLQDNVPECIADFLEAGISVWVLTGDKQETAINIGNSCRLITPSMTLLTINEGSEDDTLACIVNFAKTLEINLEEMKKKGKKAFANIVPCHAVVVIDGKTLMFALTDRVRSDFLCLCCSCKAAIVCRAAPMQKAEIVEYVTKLTGAVTLAIGDGANDVAMIQKAHVGVGISGNEGLQAACASDYAIAQFYYLKKLLFVHGAWNHDRITKAIFYSFYKNITLYIIELWFAINSYWSGQIIFERWTITTYNLCFVCMQPLAMGIFEQNCSMELRMRYPHLYLKTSHGAFTVKKFSIWMITALVHSVLLYWISNEFYSTNGLPTTIWDNGKEGSYLVLGNSIFTVVVIVVSLKMGVETKAWTKYTHFSIWGSIALWFIFLAIYSFIWTFQKFVGNDNFDMAEQLFTSPAYWLSILVIPAVTLMPDLIYAAIMGTLFRTELDHYREAEIREKALQSVAKEEPKDPVKSELEGTKPKTKLKKKAENKTTTSKTGQNKSANPTKESLEEDEVITDTPGEAPPNSTPNKGPEFTKVSLEPTSILSQRSNNKVLQNYLEQSLTDSESPGPQVLTYDAIRQKVMIGKLRSISTKVDEDPEIDARRRPTMKEIEEARVLQNLQKLDQEAKESQRNTAPISPESLGPRVLTYSSVQQIVLRSNLRSVISNNVDEEDPSISLGQAGPSAKEDFTAMIQPCWSGEKAKDSIKKKEQEQESVVPDETTDPEGNVE